MRDVRDFLATQEIVAIVEIVLEVEVTVVIDILDTTVEIDFKDVIVESVHRDFLSMIVTIDLALQDMTVAINIQRIMVEIIAVRDFRVGTEMKIQEVLIERDFSPRSQNYSSSKTVCFYCNERGHIIHNCPKITCVICNDRGHTSIECKKSRDSRSSTKSVRDVQHDGPRSLRSRSPSPYPERGRKDTPSHYINRVSIDPRTIAFSHDA